MLMLISCQDTAILQKKPSISPSLADLTQDCDPPVALKVGDNIPTALVDNTTRLVDCQNRHHQLSAFVKAQ